MKTRFAVAASVLILLLSFGASSFAEPGLRKCSAYSAVYEGHSKNSANLSYFLRIDKNMAHTGADRISSYFVFELSQKDGTKLSEFSVPFRCDGMSVVRCYLDVSDLASGQVAVAGLNEDFSETSSLSSSLAPYSIIMPNVMNAFWGGNIKADVDARFYSKEKVFPDLSMPTVWLFRKCR